MPTPTFWTAEDKIPVSQKKVSVQAENGLEYNLGQQIDFVIPASTGYMMPSETYLRMDVKINNTQLDATTDEGKKSRVCLDSELGANVLIRDIRVSSGGAQNILLEELQNVNVLTALKYDYETNDTLKKKRALTEGSFIQTTPEQRGTDGCTMSATTNLSSNPWWSNSTTFSNANHQTVKALLQLPTGIFQNDKIFPLGLTDGLRVQIILEDPSRVFRQMDTVSKYRNLTANPRVHSVNGSNTAPDAWVAGALNSPGKIYVARSNANWSLSNFPFCVGEKISFISLANGDDAKAGANVVITEITYDQTVGGTNANSGLIKVAFDSATNGNAFNIDSTFALYSTTVEDNTAFQPTVSVNNVELIVQKVEMPEGYTRKMNSMLKAGGSMNYDFLSYTNYKHSQQQTDTVANIRLPIGNSRCKSILCIPTDATTYTTQQAISGSDTYVYDALAEDSGDTATTNNKSQRSGLVGIADHASNYQFIYDGKLNPNRKVPLSRISVNGAHTPLNQQCLIEQEKALHMAGIDPLSFEANRRNFFIGRALSLQNGVYDARGRDFNLQVEYQEATSPTKQKLWNCWVAHLRRIVVKGENIALEV
jgi:hypothetical protein